MFNDFVLSFAVLNSWDRMIYLVDRVAFVQDIWVFAFLRSSQMEPNVGVLFCLACTISFGGREPSALTRCAVCDMHRCVLTQHT